MADEIASTGTYHTHIFIYSPSPIRFTTLKTRFPTAHIEKAFGSAQENKEYITKTGKWADDKKAETSVEGTFEEYGNMPSEKAEQNPAMYALIEDIINGKRTGAIIEAKPNLAFKTREIDNLRQAVLSEHNNEFRNVEVSYIYGATGTGKTRGIYKKHSATDVCRITSYRKGGNGVYFDSYTGQDVLVFEEFYSQIPIEEMLNFLDIYPLMLPARYSDKIALYTKVCITSNIPLLYQYQDEQIKRAETWQAFFRRINKLIEYKENGEVIETILNPVKEDFIEK